MACFGTVDLSAAGGADILVFLATEALTVVGVEAVEEMEVRRFASTIMEANVDVVVVDIVKKKSEKSCSCR